MVTPLPECPNCQSFNAELIGSMSGVTRFRCRDCNERFYTKN
jgi:transposase-like protein